jgi:hypothetical protein
MEGTKQSGSTAEWETVFERDPRAREYNYEHFRTRHFLADLRRLVRGEGVWPGQEAPDFELESTKRERVRLSALRGKPVVLRFASFTWPIAAGAVAPIKSLHGLYGVLAHAPTLKRAIDELLAKEGRGIVSGDVDRWPHVFASLVDGWRGPRRGGLRAVLDYELAVPGAATLTFLGHLAKPVLSPLALRSTPLPVSARLTLGSGLIATTALGAWLLRRRG